MTAPCENYESGCGSIKPAASSELETGWQPVRTCTNLTSGTRHALLSSYCVTDLVVSVMSAARYTTVSNPIDYRAVIRVPDLTSTIIRDAAGLAANRIAHAHLEVIIAIRQTVVTVLVCCAA